MTLSVRASRVQTSEGITAVTGVVANCRVAAAGAGRAAEGIRGGYASAKQNFPNKIFPAK
jgi:hypothetical protein